MATSVQTVDSARDLGVVVDSHLMKMTHVIAVCRAAYYQLWQLRPLIRLLSFDATKFVVQAFISTRLDYCSSLLYGISDSLYRCLQAVQNAAARLITNTSRCARPAAATLASSPPTCSIQDRRAGVQGTAQPLACVPGGRLSTCVCHWTPTTAFIGHWHVPSAVKQHTFWRSLICCCWTSSMEQSANPAARVRHNTQTVQRAHKMHLFGHWQAAAPSDCFLCAVCKLAYLLTYLTITISLTLNTNPEIITNSWIIDHVSSIMK